MTAKQMQTQTLMLKRVLQKADGDRPCLEGGGDKTVDRIMSKLLQTLPRTLNIGGMKARLTEMAVVLLGCPEALRTPI
jgi:hypothetical protein